MEHSWWWLHQYLMVTSITTVLLNNTEEDSFTCMGPQGLLMWIAFVLVTILPLLVSTTVVPAPSTQMINAKFLMSGLEASRSLLSSLLSSPSCFRFIPNLLINDLHFFSSAPKPFYEVNDLPPSNCSDKNWTNSHLVRTEIFMFCATLEL